MSSVEQPCSHARVVCSRRYKLVGRGCRPKSLRMSVWFVGYPTLVTVASSPFYRCKGRGNKGKEIKSYSVGH
jgi:hypothetical protein